MSQFAYLKIKADLVRAAGGKTLALTATPVSNCVAEIFNMLRIFAPKVLAKRGILNTQQLMDTYCMLDSITSVSPTGKIVSGQTITGFKNLDDLRELWTEAMITRTADDVKLPLPRVRELVVRVQPTPAIKAFMDELKALLDQAVRNRDTGAAREVHLFTILSQLDAVAAHPASVGLSSNPKGEKLAQTVWDIYREGKGGQIVFSDRLESQEGIRDLLVAKGIPEREIVIVNAASAPHIDDRLRIQDRFNEGTTRVIIGGAVTSEGIDLQRNTVAIHFNNLAWEGQTIHQRKGRGVRQGNRNAEVRVYYYLLDGSTDNYRFLTTQNKAHWWESLRTAQTDRIAENVFSQPMSDDLIASLAANPEEILNLLQEQRRDKARAEELEKISKLIRRLVSFADPRAPAVSQPILASYEKALRGLSCVSESFADAVIERVEILAWCMDRSRANHRDRKWDTQDLKYAPFLTDRDQPARILKQWFPIQSDENGFFHFDGNLDPLLKPEWQRRLPTMPKTYGQSEPIEHESARKLDTRQAPNPVVWIDPETKPEIPRATLPEANPSDPNPAEIQPLPSQATGAFIPGVQMTFGFNGGTKPPSKNAPRPIAKPQSRPLPPSPKHGVNRAVQLSFGF